MSRSGKSNSSPRSIRSQTINVAHHRWERFFFAWKGQGPSAFQPPAVNVPHIPGISLHTSLPMSITEIAKQVWLHSHSFPFGQSEFWQENLFTKAWAEAQDPAVPFRTYQAGWYWLITDLSVQELQAVPRPGSLPHKGCDISALSCSNSKIFGPTLLCAPDATNKVVVYNGHEGRVCDRVRSHFSLKNDRTGALGLKHYSLQKRAWEVRVFSTPCLDSLQVEDRDRVQRIMDSKSGRCAVETAWRAVFGWPILCKE